MFYINTIFRKKELPLDRRFADKDTKSVDSRRLSNLPAQMRHVHIRFEVALDVELSQPIGDRSEKGDVIFAVMMGAATLDGIVAKVMSLHFSMLEDKFLTLVELLNW